MSDVPPPPPSSDLYEGLPPPQQIFGYPATKPKLQKQQLPEPQSTKYDPLAYAAFTKQQSYYNEPQYYQPETAVYNYNQYPSTTTAPPPSTYNNNNTTQYHNNELYNEEEQPTSYNAVPPPSTLISGRKKKYKQQHASQFSIKPKISPIHNNNNNDTDNRYPSSSGHHHHHLLQQQQQQQPKPSYLSVTTTTGSGRETNPLHRLPSHHHQPTYQGAAAYTPAAAPSVPGKPIAPSQWPPALKTYVERSFRSMPTENRATLQKALKIIIADAQNTGELLTRNWDVLPLPDVTRLSADAAANLVVQVAAINTTSSGNSSKHLFAPRVGGNQGGDGYAERQQTTTAAKWNVNNNNNNKSEYYAPLPPQPSSSLYQQQKEERQQQQQQDKYVPRGSGDRYPPPRDMDMMAYPPLPGKQGKKKKNKKKNIDINGGGGKYAAAAWNDDGRYPSAGDVGPTIPMRRHAAADMHITGKKRKKQKNHYDSEEEEEEERYTTTAAATHHTGGVGGDVESRRRQQRAGRFGDGAAPGARPASASGDDDSGIMERSLGSSAAARRRRYLDQLSLYKQGSAGGSTGGGGGGGDEDFNWDAISIKGTCQSLEKSYFRLTSAPDPSTVRPEAVLRAALKRLVKMIADPNIYNNPQQGGGGGGGVNYFYALDQFKGMRQDLTVQHIRNSLTVAVYEAHGRAALEYGDVPEYNQCQGQLAGLYAELRHNNGSSNNKKKKGGRFGTPPTSATTAGGGALPLPSPSLSSTPIVAGLQHYAEFLAYRILYQTVHAKQGEGLQLLNTLKKEVSQYDASLPEVAHALQVRSAMVSGDYVGFFKLYGTAPHLGRALMDMAVPEFRFSALKRMVAAFKPNVPVAFIASVLGFVSRKEEEDNSGGITISLKKKKGQEGMNNNTTTTSNSNGNNKSLAGCATGVYIGKHAPNEDRQAGLTACEEWLRECGAVVVVSGGDSGDGMGVLDCKQSTGQLKIPENKEAVAHGDANLAIEDFLKGFGSMD